LECALRLLQQFVRLTSCNRRRNRALQQGNLSARKTEVDEVDRGAAAYRPPCEKPTAFQKTESLPRSANRQSHPAVTLNGASDDTPTHDFTFEPRLRSFRISHRPLHETVRLKRAQDICLRSPACVRGNTTCGWRSRQAPRERPRGRVSGRPRS